MVVGVDTVELKTHELAKNKQAKNSTYYNSKTNCISSLKKFDISPVEGTKSERE